MGRVADEARRRRVGIFGGTFDPPHDGHVSVARDVADALGLDEVLWIPVGSPPHKTGVALTPPSLRLQMTRAAAATDPRFRVSEIELRRSGPSYTVDTLRQLSADNAMADAELFLIMGYDQYRDFGSWRSPDEIRGLATLAVMDRGGESLPRPGAGRSNDDAEADGIVRVQVRRVDVSSTDIRARAARGEDVSDLVPSAVGRLIAGGRLYRS